MYQSYSLIMGEKPLPSHLTSTAIIKSILPRISKCLCCEIEWSRSWRAHQLMVSIYSSLEWHSHARDIGERWKRLGSTDPQCQRCYKVFYEQLWLCSWVRQRGDP